MDGADFHAWWTASLLVIFLGIIIWAWSRRRRTDFEAAARMPLEDDDPSSGNAS